MDKIFCVEFQREPIVGAETEPARRRWRRPASRPVLSRYCIFFVILEELSYPYIERYDFYTTLKF